MRIGIKLCELREEIFDATGLHEDQQLPGSIADVLEAMRNVSRSEDRGSRFGSNRFPLDVELEGSVDDVEKFVFAMMNVRRRPAARRSDRFKQRKRNNHL